MKRVKKVIAIVLITLILLIACIASTGCTKKKYDITLKVVCWARYNSTIIEEYVFTPDISVIEVEREYDGKEYQYRLYTYTGLDYVQQGEWFQPDIVTNRFDEELFEEGKGNRLSYVCDKGRYIYTAHSPRNSKIMNYRQIELKITIK